MHICSDEWTSLKEREKVGRGKNQIARLNSSSMQFAVTKTMKWQIPHVRTKECIMFRCRRFRRLKFSISVTVIVINLFIVIFILARLLRQPTTHNFVRKRGNIPIVRRKDEPIPRPHVPLRGLNCHSEDAFLRVKTDEVWESRVVKEIHGNEVHCVRIKFHYQDIPIKSYDFRGSEVIINLSRSPIMSSDAPVVQPWYGGWGFFREYFDIVATPFYQEHCSQRDLYTVLHEEERIKVVLPIDFTALIQTPHNPNTTTWEREEMNSKRFNFVVVPTYCRLCSLVFTCHLGTALRNGAIPIVVGERGVYVDDYLPFSEVLDWKKALIITDTARLKILINDYIPNLPFYELHRMRRKCYKFWQSYMSTKERVLDTTMAVIRQRLGLEPPYFMEYRTRDATSQKASYFLPKERHKWQRSSHEDVYFRWNEVFHPWEKTPFPFHLGVRRPDMAGFPKETTRELDNEKFTIVIKSYRRIMSVCELLVGLRGLTKVDRVIIVWNDVTAQVPEDLTRALPKDKLFIMRPKQNSLQNFFLPMDLIRTDAVLTMDDDVRVSNFDLNYAFRAWQEDPTNHIGFIPRSIRKTENGTYEYDLSDPIRGPDCHYNVVLTGLSFLHKFYLYQYTYIQPQEIREKVEELFNCEDIFMSAMISDLTMQPPVQMKLASNKESGTVLCMSCTGGESISYKQGHKERRDHCSNLIKHFYGHQPLVSRRSITTHYPCFKNEPHFNMLYNVVADFWSFKPKSGFECRDINVTRVNHTFV